MTVITISRQYGSGGDEIANQICELLKYRQFDKRQIAQAAMDVGFTSQEIIDYSEEDYKVKNFVDTLLRRTHPVAQVRVWREETSGIRIAETQAVNEDVALALVQKAIRAAYESGDMVILGRGGQIILKDCRNVLHIRLEAALEERIYRVKSQLRATKESFDATVDDRRAAQDLIETRDLASSNYIRQYYGVDWADPLLYHAILNTSKLGINQTARVIVEMVHCMTQKA